ncbi:nucleotidyltransferase domain-containing protein [Embleya sp. NPDC020886]|uniref:nucleotidyltransferase domain-containing protein n=1 Tax=Embleya sp. NPDC020886 TaxID=3363980 RepID=UPI0037AEE32F
MWGGDLIGAYLHGSSVLGGLKPASDVDVLLVSRRSMDKRERRALFRSGPGRRGGHSRFA